RRHFCAFRADCPDVLPAGCWSGIHALSAIFDLRYLRRDVLGGGDDFGRLLSGENGAEHRAADSLCDRRSGGGVRASGGDQYSAGAARGRRWGGSVEVAARRVRAVIFDIGRVLIRIDVARAMKGMASGLSLSPEELWSAIEKDPRWKDWQEGRIS